MSANQRPMSVNATTLAIRLRKRNQTWAEFDALSRSVKQALWDAPIKVNITDVPPAQLARAFDRFMAKFARDTEAKYGPDHPQSASALARRARTESTIEGDDLGF